jgi:hypothetical protein
MADTGGVFSRGQGDALVPRAGSLGRWARRSFVATLAGLCLVAGAGCGAGGGGEQPLGTATEHFLAAQDAIGKGDDATALKELDASITLQADSWALFERAQLHVKMKQVDKALADCAAGLSLDKDHVQLKWLQEELKKPAENRFQGKNAKPPVDK